METPKSFKFTTERLTDLRPAPERYEVRDEGCTGLVVRVTPRGAKTFAVFRWVKASGRAERVTLGSFPEMGVAKARAQATTVGAAIVEGRSPQAERRTQKTVLTLEDLFDKYMTEHVRKHLSKKADVDFTGLWTLHVPKDMRQRRITEITRDDIEALHTKIGKAKEVTANKVVGFIRGMFNKSAPAVLNPARGVQKFHVEPNTRYLKADEMPKWTAALAETPQPHRDLFRLLMLTGVRLSNMLAANFDQFDMTHATWTVPGAQHKNKRPHTMNLTSEALAIVARRRRASPGPWLWPATGKRKSASGHLTRVSVEWKDLVERAGIEHLRRHDLRHTLASWMVIDGQSLPMIGKQLGHVSQQSTAIYAHISAKAVEPALKSAVAAMDKAGKRKR